MVEEAPRRLQADAQIEKALLTAKDLRRVERLPAANVSGGSELRRDHHGVIRVGRTLVMLASYETGGSMAPQDSEAVARTAVEKPKAAA